MDKVGTQASRQEDKQEDEQVNEQENKQVNKQEYKQEDGLEDDLDRVGIVEYTIHNNWFSPQYYAKIRDVAEYIFRLSGLTGYVTG